MFIQRAKDGKQKKKEKGKFSDENMKQFIIRETELISLDLIEFAIQ